MSRGSNACLCEVMGPSRERLVGESAEERLRASRGCPERPKSGLAVAHGHAGHTRSASYGY